MGEREKNVLKRWGACMMCIQERIRGEERSQRKKGKICLAMMGE
jgi:hypothetical protein